MPFGDLISKSNEKIELVTADDQTVIIDSKIKRLGLKIFGIPHTEMRTRARMIFNNCIIKKRSKILDAGCGIGLYGLEYASKDDCYVVGVDLSKNKIINAQKIKKNLNIENITFEEGDITKLSYKKDSFDIIICSDVLEHIRDDEMAMTELIRVLKKGGEIFLTFPYLGSDSPEVMRKYGHQRSGYNKEMIEYWTKKYNLSLEKINGYSYLFSNFIWRINEKTFKIPVISAVLFYPLYILTYSDFFKLGKPRGLFVKLKKN